MADKKELEMLQLVQTSHMPVGAAYLSERMGLPQATVGRILLALEKKGYLEKVSNKGRLLTEQGVSYLAQQEQYHEKLRTARNIIETAESNEKHKLYEILEIRLALEGLSAENAAINATEEDMKQLDGIMLEHFYDLRRGGIGSEQDLQMHLKIAEMSGNQTLAQILRLLLTQENAYTKFSIVAPHITNMQIRQHTDIVESIRAREAQRAREAMVTHLRQVMEDVQNFYDSGEN